MMPALPDPAAPGTATGLEVTRTHFPLAETFTISRGSRTQAEVVTVTVQDAQGCRGQGECVPYARYGESLDSVTAQITNLSLPINRSRLQAQLPAGAARNAVDCALWDLEAKRSGQPVWRLAGLPGPPKPRLTAFTLSLDTPQRMQAAAQRHAHRPLLKIKLGGGPEDLQRLIAVRSGAPQARLIIDANEGWTAAQYTELAPQLLELGVDLVEQPLPAADDAALARLAQPLPVCADESCHDRASLPALQGKYSMINIKLDKTGGLTEALALQRAAQAAGLQIMIGCMVGSSLAMAPALLLAQTAAIVDLDGPLLLAQDRTPGLYYSPDGQVHPPQPALWG